MQWENVYVFISSTFNDMHAERDYLVKRVFPQLSAWCEERKLRLVDIDLRWGVSEVDATQNKRVVQVCLDRIDACRPFFLCFLGQRRGWVPEKSDIDSETYKNFPKLLEKHYSGNASVTEMEILHALIDPLHNGILRLADDSTQTADPVKHALFFLRDPGYLEGISHPDTHKIYSNEIEADQVKADAELKRWREEVIPEINRPIFNYSASWIVNETTPEIALPLYVPTTAPHGSELWEVAFERWGKMWESKGVKVNSNGEITDQAELAKARTYNQSFTRGRLSGFQHNGTDLAEIIIEQLQAAIIERYGDRAIPVLTSLQHELDQQAQFLHVASEGFIERDGDFEEINSYITEGEAKPFGLTANAGMGKTSLLAHFVDTYQPKEANETIHYRFVGGSDDSVSAERLVRSLLTELTEQGKIYSGIPTNAADMLSDFSELLNEAGQQGKTILIIDALNQLESGMENILWIPSMLPENVKLIVSFKRGEQAAEEYYKQQSENQTMILHTIKPFDSMDDRKKLVKTYLAKFFKELDEPRIQALISSDGAENPLFLKIVLSELRVFGVHNNLSDMVKNNFGNTPVSAYISVLGRMESDPVYTKLSPTISLPHVFGWLAHSKYGLSVEELAQLLIKEKLTDNFIVAQDAVFLILRQIRPYLAKRDGRIDFFYDSFKIAAIQKYTKEHQHARTALEWHRSLAEYFESLPIETPHRLMEQAWQYVMAKNNVQYKALLFDYRFIDARLNAFDIRNLIEDYDYADDNETMLLRDCLRLCSHTLAIRKDQLADQLWGRMASFKEVAIAALLAQIISEKKEHGEIWLRPRCICFNPPGGAIYCTLNVRAIAVAFVENGSMIVAATANEQILYIDPVSCHIIKKATANDEIRKKLFSAMDGTAFSEYERSHPDNSVTRWQEGLEEKFFLKNNRYFLTAIRDDMYGGSLLDIRHTQVDKQFKRINFKSVITHIRFDGADKCIVITFDEIAHVVDLLNKKVIKKIDTTIFPFFSSTIAYGNIGVKLQGSGSLIFIKNQAEDKRIIHDHRFMIKEIAVCEATGTVLTASWDSTLCFRDPFNADNISFALTAPVYSSGEDLPKGSDDSSELCKYSGADLSQDGLTGLGMVQKKGIIEIIDTKGYKTKKIKAKDACLFSENARFDKMGKYIVYGETNKVRIRPLFFGLSRSLKLGKNKGKHIDKVYFSQSGKYLFALVNDSIVNYVKIWEWNKPHKNYSVTSDLSIASCDICEENHTVLLNNYDCVQIIDFTTNAVLRKWTTTERIGLTQVALFAGSAGLVVQNSLNELQIYDSNANEVIATFSAEYEICAISIMQKENVIIAGDRAGYLYYLTPENIRNFGKNTNH